MTLKSILAAVALVALTVNANAQDKKFFNHLSVGVTAGTPGFGIDVATPVGDYVQLRGGVAVFPSISTPTDLERFEGESNVSNKALSALSLPSSVEFEGKVGFTNAKLLADVYPFKRSSFHVTVGAYIGSSDIVTVKNSVDGALNSVNTYNSLSSALGYETTGIVLGDLLLTPDAQGNIKAAIKTSAVKPYVGLGFGRAVPKKRVGLMVELGAQIWGSPTVFCNDTSVTSHVGSDANDILSTLSQIIIYPVLNFRLCGRIF